MFDFIMGNLATILVGAAIAAWIVFAAIKMIRDRKNGKGTCGCHCAGCPSAGMCHKK